MRKHPGLDYVTSDSPSGYLVESEIAMLGRLASGPTRRARIFGRILAGSLLILFAASMLACLFRVFI